MDHYIKTVCGEKYYGRYMDDFYLLSDDKEYLKRCLIKIQEYLADLKLTLNNKTEIVPMSKGIRFLGFHTYLTEQGNVIRKLDGDNKRQVKKRLRKYAKLVAQERMTRERFNEIYNSWRNHASHGNCFKLIYEMDLFVEELFGEEKKELRVIIAGSRTFNNYTIVENTLNRFIKEHQNNRITIISGAARGADQLGEQYAKEKCFLLKRFPAQWEQFGKRAGFLRNIQMLDYIDTSDCDSYVVIFWDGKSKGTKQLIGNVKKRNIPYKIISI